MIVKMKRGKISTDFGMELWAAGMQSLGESKGAPHPS